MLKKSIYQDFCLEIDYWSSLLSINVIFLTNIPWCVDSTENISVPQVKYLPSMTPALGKYISHLSVYSEYCLNCQILHINSINFKQKSKNLGSSYKNTDNTKIYQFLESGKTKIVFN